MGQAGHHDTRQGDDLKADKPDRQMRMPEHRAEDVDPLIHVDARNQAQGRWIAQDWRWCLKPGPPAMP